MNYDATALIKNNELKMENETLKPFLSGLMKENGELAFRINNAHRIAGTQSPLKMNWRMSYGYEPRRPVEWTIDEHAGGGRKAKRSKRSKRSKSRRSKRSKHGGDPTPTPTPNPTVSVPQFSGSQNAGANGNIMGSNHVAMKAGAQAALDNPNAAPSNTVLP